MELTVCFWNILFDDFQPSSVESQTDRLPEILNTLRQLPDDAIIGLSEVEGVKNGELLANQLGNQTGFFIEHDRPNDHIGVTSKQILNPQAIQIDDTCRAIAVEVSEITVVAVHMTWTFFNERMRRRQITSLLSQLDDSSPMVIMGDFNSMSWQSSRKLIEKAGFRSVLGRSLRRRLPTVPTREFLHMYPQPYRTLGRIGLTVDDVYIRGLDLLDSGVFKGQSDHLGVWATVKLP